MARDEQRGSGSSCQQNHSQAKSMYLSLVHDLAKAVTAASVMLFMAFE
jgi:hypothetical protein